MEQNVSKKEIAKAILTNGEAWACGVAALMELGCAIYFGAYAFGFTKACIESNKFKIQELKINK